MPSTQACLRASAALTDFSGARFGSIVMTGQVDEVDHERTDVIRIRTVIVTAGAAAPKSRERVGVWP